MAADDQMILALQRVALRQVAEHGTDVVQFGSRNFGVEQIKHPLGTVGADDGPDKRLQSKRQQSGAAAKIQDVHVAGELHLPDDGIGNISGQFDSLRLLIPGGGGLIKIPFGGLHRWSSCLNLLVCCRLQPSMRICLKKVPLLRPKMGQKDKKPDQHRHHCRRQHTKGGHILGLADPRPVFEGDFVGEQFNGR